MNAAVAVAVALAVAPACTFSQYRPRPGPFISQVQALSGPQWVVEGRSYPASPLGSGLAQAVAAVPEARAYAEESQNDAVLAAITVPLGTMLLAGGLSTFLISSALDDDPLSGGKGALTLSLMAAGLSASAAGVFFAVSSEARQMDAVNLYNDTMWLRTQGAP